MSLFGPNVEKMKTRGDVKGLLKLLRENSDERLRLTAVEALGDLGDDSALETLAGLIEKREPQPIRTAAAGALIKFKQRAIKPLIAQLERASSSAFPDPVARAEITPLLKRLGKPALEALLPALYYNARYATGGGGLSHDHCNAIIEALLPFGAASAQAAAARFLEKAKYGNEELIREREYLRALLKKLYQQKAADLESSIAMLGEALKDTNEYANKNLADLLRDLGEDGARTLKALKDSRDNFKQTVERARTAPDAQAIQSLSAALRDPDVEVRRIAAQTLAGIASPQVFQTLLLALQVEGRETRVKVIESLGKLGDARAIDALVPFLNNPDSDVGKAAARALNAIGTPRIIPPLLAALKQGDDSLNPVIETILEKMDGEQVFNAVSNLVNDENYNLRLSAIRIIGGLGGDAALDILMRAIQEPDPEIKKNAARLLGNLGDVRASSLLLDYLFSLSQVFPVAGPRSTPVRALDGVPSVVNAAFGDYTKIIMRNVTIQSLGVGAGFEWVYPLEDNLNALKELCGIKTPISTNLLHRVAVRADLMVPHTYFSEMGSYEMGKLSLKPLRDLAEQELTNRGNPPHDPSIYPLPEAWKINKIS